MFNDIKAMLLEGVQKGCYPGAVLLVAHGGSVVFLDAVGFRTLLPHTFPMDTDTFFDLASLTKVLATTMCIMMLTDRGLFGLDQSIADILSQELPKDKREITPRMLLNHCSGLPSWRPFYLDLIMYPSVERKVLLRKWIIEQPLVYPPASKTVYSDLGFMLIGRMVEKRSGKSLAEYIKDKVYQPLGLENDIFFNNLNLKTVPVLETNYKLSGNIEELVRLSVGKSVLNDIQREGIVLRPLKEIEDSSGRISFKAINPKFLLKYE